jgi:hypothetical protein
MVCSSFIKSRFSLKIFLLLIASLLSCTAPRHVQIKPDVKASRAGVDITNRDAFTYPQVTVFVKGHYFAEVGDIASGQTVHLPFEKFVNSEGQTFDMTTMTPEVIRVRAWFDGQAASKNYEVK